MNNPLTTIEKPTKASALAALTDMKEPSVWVPGLGAIVLLFLLGQSALLCAGTVGITLYLSRLWSRLAKKPPQQ